MEMSGSSSNSSSDGSTTGDRTENVLQVRHILEDCEGDAMQLVRIEEPIPQNVISETKVVMVKVPKMARDIEEVFDVKQCPVGHVLKQFFTHRDEFKCDRCDLLVPTGSVMFSCRWCDWDLCPDCYVQTCPKGHRLRRTSKKRMNGLQCDSCETELESSMIVFSCGTCDWDTCSNCMASLKQHISGRQDGHPVLPSAMSTSGNTADAVNYLGIDHLEVSGDSQPTQGPEYHKGNSSHSRDANAPDLVQACPEGHRLRKGAASLKGLECDLCAVANIQIGDLMYSCAKCDFDICENCHFIAPRKQFNMGLDLASRICKLQDHHTITAQRNSRIIKSYKTKATDETVETIKPQTKQTKKQRSKKRKSQVLLSIEANSSTTSTSMTSSPLSGDIGMGFISDTENQACRELVNSLYQGVVYNTVTRRWQVARTVQGRTVHVGAYEYEVEAAIAHDTDLLLMGHRAKNYDGALELHR